MSATIKTLDDKVVNAIAKETSYAVVAAGNHDVDSNIKAFQAKAIPSWPVTVRNLAELDAQMTKIRDMTPIAAGDAEEIYKKVLALKSKEYDVSHWVRAKKVGEITRSEVLGSQLTVIDGKVKPVVDVIAFKTEMATLIGRIDRLDILKKVAKNSAEQDFWDLVVQMLEIEETFELIGLISAKMLLGREDQSMIDGYLSKITVLQNKTGKLSTGLMRLIGFTGLACVKGESQLARAMKFIKNPLLGEDVDPSVLRQRDDENDANFKTRKEKSVVQFAAYKEIMVQMKEHKKHFDSLPESVKGKIKSAVLKYTIAD